MSVVVGGRWGAWPRLISPEAVRVLLEAAVIRASRRHPGDAEAVVKAAGRALGRWSTDWTTSCYGGDGGPGLWCEDDEVVIDSIRSLGDTPTVRLRWRNDRWEVTARYDWFDDEWREGSDENEAPHPLVEVLMGGLQFEYPNAYLMPMPR